VHVVQFDQVGRTGAHADSLAEFKAGMSITTGYHFALHDAKGVLSDDLGDLQLADDDDAIDHARQVVRDMLVDNPIQYPRWTMNITQDGRVVRTLAVR
jgi:hypothetical protein